MSEYECVNDTGCTNRQEPGCGLGGCKDRKDSQLEQNTGEDYTEEFINKALEGIAKDFCDKKRALYILNKIDEGQCGIKAWDLICDAKDYLK